MEKMTNIILGALIGAGIAFTALAIWTKKEQKTIDEWERWRRRKP